MMAFRWSQPRGLADQFDSINSVPTAIHEVSSVRTVKCDFSVRYEYPGVYAANFVPLPLCMEELK